MRQVIKHRDIRLLNMIRRTDPVIPNVTNPMNIYSDFHLCRHFLGLSMNVFVGLSFARLCRLPQQELCQTNKEKNYF